MDFKSFSEYLSEAKGEMTFVFGRFNPPTTGHEKLFEKLKKVSGGSYRIYASKSQDPKKNPLTFKEKIKFMRKMFPKHARNIMADADVRTVIDIAVKLYDQGYTKVSMVAGSDRVKEFDTLLNKYNGQKARHGFYNFEDGIKVISAGERDPDAEGVSGMSASKLRAFVAAGDLQGFADNSLEIPGDGIQTLYYALRKGMNLKRESVRKHIELAPVSEKREKFVEGNLFKEGDEVVLKETNQVGVIQRCGTNFLVVEFGQWKKRVWLDDVEHLEEKCGAGEFGTKKLTSQYKKDTPGQKEEKKYSDMNAKQKAAHDKERPNAPESKHTKNFKKKFGEMKSFSQSLEEADAKAALMKKADKTGMPYGILKKVFDRGYAAWKSSHRPGTNPTQWGLARVNSFATKSKGTWGGADKDLAAKVRG